MTLILCHWTRSDELRMNSVETILIVDNDSTTRRLIRSVLARQGYRILEVADGQEGVEAFQRESPDLVLRDVMMLRLDGYAACRPLRQLERNTGTPIIMLTAADAGANVEQAFESGASDFISKPISWPLLMARVRHALRARRTTTSTGFAPRPRRSSAVPAGRSPSARKPCFGSSSLEYLLRFPLDAITIDRAFIKDIVESPSDRAIVRAVTVMAQSTAARLRRAPAKQATVHAGTSAGRQGRPVKRAEPQAAAMPADNSSGPPRGWYPSPSDLGQLR